jgi:hypothetical protein
MADLYRLSKAKQSNKEKSLPLIIHRQDVREISKPRLFLLSRWLLGVYEISHSPR